jgi:hypothetical protein
MHVIEAMNARDAVVQRLADAYDIINQKNDTIENLKREYGAQCARLLSPSGTRPDADEDGEKRKLHEHIAKLEGVVRNLQEDLKFWRSTNGGDGRSPSDPPPNYEEGRMHLKVKLILAHRPFTDLTLFSGEFRSVDVCTAAPAPG